MSERRDPIWSQPPRDVPSEAEKMAREAINRFNLNAFEPLCPADADLMARILSRLVGEPREVSQEAQAMAETTYAALGEVFMDDAMKANSIAILGRLVLSAQVAQAEADAKIAASYGPSRPEIPGREYSPLMCGRWEGEQAASDNIARLIRDALSKLKESTR